MNATQALHQLNIGHQQYRKALQQGTMITPLSLAHANIHQPIAAIVSCSDARVVPEFLFGQSLGQLFVVRAAANMIDTQGLASLEFAVGQLGVSLIIVLGHRGCGAIQATVDALLTENTVSEGYLEELIAKLKPVIRSAQKESDYQEIANQAVLNNIQYNVGVIQRSSPVLAKHVIAKSVEVVGAVYCHQKGDLQFIETT